jgi:hypothetical protein
MVVDRRTVTPEAATHTFEEWFEIYGPTYKNLAGIRRHLSNIHGREDWTEDQYVQYMMEIYEHDRDKLVRKPPKELPIPTGPAEDRFQAYMQYYEDPAPNDILLLRQMARIEVQLNAIQNQWETAVSEGSRVASKGWSDMVRSLTDTHRNIQSTLGISRSARDRTKSREDLVDYIQDIIGKTADFLDDHAVKIRCPHCVVSPAETEIDMGFILFHFRQDTPWHFEFQCPLCGETVRFP